MSLSEFSNEDLISGMKELEIKYPFLPELVSTLQLSSQKVTDGGPSHDRPDKINNKHKGENMPKTKLEALKSKVNTLKAQSGIVVVGEQAESAEQSEDVDYTEFIDTLTDAISDLKKDAGNKWEVWSAKLQAYDANQKLIAIQLEQIAKALKAQGPSPEKLGNEFQKEESQGGLDGDKKRTKMEEKRASKKVPKKASAKKAEEEMVMEEEEEESHSPQSTSELQYEEEGEEEVSEPEPEEEEEEVQPPKMEAIKRDRNARKAVKDNKGKGVNNTDENTPNFPAEYGWVKDILTAGKQAFGWK